MPIFQISYRQVAATNRDRVLGLYRPSCPTKLDGGWGGGVGMICEVMESWKGGPHPLLWHGLLSCVLLSTRATGIRSGICAVIQGWVARLIARPLASAALRGRIQTFLKNHKRAT